MIETTNEVNTMGEFASKGVAGSGLGLGIAGTALGVLSASQNGNGLLGNLFGTGGYTPTAASIIADKNDEIFKLQSEKYTDHSGIDLYKQIKGEINGLSDRLLDKYISPLSQEASGNRERLVAIETSLVKDREINALKEQLINSKIDNTKCELTNTIDKVRCEMVNGDERLNNKIDRVADHASCGINRLTDAVAGISKIVDGITCTKVCRDAICPEVMPRYNSWTAPTAEAPATQPVTGTISVI